MARMRTVLVTVALVAAAPVLVGIGIITAQGADSPLDADAPSMPVVEPVTTSNWSPTIAADVTLRIAEGVSVRVTDSGLVTKVAVTVGDTVTAGEEVVTVADRRVSAFVAAAPLWRDVQAGTKGADVVWAEEYLQAVGYDPGGIDEVATAQTARAIKAYNADHGRAADGRVLTMAGLAWVGPGPLVLEAVDVKVGDLLDGSTPVGVGESVAVAVDVVEKGDATDWPAQAPAVLVVGGARVPYDRASGEIASAPDVATIAAAVADVGSDDGRAAGSITPANVIDAMAVPVTAVVTDAEGRTCVFPGATAAPVVVAPLDGGISTVLLPADTPIATVLVNPRAVIATPECR